MNNLKDLDSTIDCLGTQSTIKVAKSGCPVTGQIEVNSGTVILILYNEFLFLLFILSNLYLMGLSTTFTF